MIRTESVDRYKIELEKERIKDQGGEDIMGDHKGRIERWEAKNKLK